METFKTLEEIFSDEDYESLIKDIQPKKEEKVDPEVEEFLELLTWIETHGREPQRTGTKERLLAARLRGIRQDENRIQKLKPYDTVGVLGDGEDGS